MALLRDPDQTGQSVTELNRLIEEYSYFHTGHQLYLQSLKKTDETQLTHHLGRSAMNVRDRGLLYNYINRPSLFRQLTTEPQENIEEVMSPFAPGSAFASPAADIHQIQQSQTPISSIPEQTGIHHAGFEGFKDESAERILAEEKIMSDAELLAIIQQQLSHIKTPDVKADDKIVVPDATATKDVADVKDRVEVKDEAERKEEVHIPPPVKETSSTAGPGEKSQFVYSADQLASNLADLLPKQEPSLADTILAELKKAEESNKTEVVAAEPQVEVVTDNLIDAFLKNNPKIVPSESDYQVDLTDSLQEDQDIATETLADIYVSQGHKQKAIEIYKHLILKYPEKHIYFAAQIDRLK